MGFCGGMLGSEMEMEKPSSGSGGCGIEDGFGDDRSGRDSSLPQFKITDSSPGMWV